MRPCFAIIRFLPASLVWLFALASCHTPTRVLRGSIAVVLESGQAFKPAQAPVWLVEAGAAQKHLSALNTELPRARLDAEIARTQADHEAVRSERRNLSYQGTSLASALKLAEENKNQAAATNALAELEKCDQERARLSNKELGLEKSLAELEEQKCALTNRLFLRPWPGTLARTTTDAEGRFALVTPLRANVVLLATCSLKNEDRNDHWQWFIPVTATNSLPLLLDQKNSSLK